MDWGSAIVAGLAATAVMTALMYMGKAMGMPMDMPRMLGLMFGEPDNSGAVYGAGAVVHVMMGAVFGVVYAAIFELLNVDPSWGLGALLGVAHGVVAGMAFGMMPALHPRMGVGKVLAAPGLFGVNYGAMVPVGVIMLHVIFGAVVGGVYGAA
jgi:hypothetical protein